MALHAFIGRQDEVGLLDGLLEKKTASIAVVRGRRRIGKTRLIEEFARDYRFYSFEGLVPDEGITAQHQRDHFSLLLSQQTELPEVSVDDWTKLFILLADQVKTGRAIILFDEISWMAEGDKTFLPKLKSAWDKYFCKNPALLLVICGSVSAWIEKNIINSTGFIGRISLELVLKELPLVHCNELLDSVGFKRSCLEKFTYLSLSGCIPWYIEQLNPALSAEDNIKQLCFLPQALMVKEFKRVFHDLFGKRGEIYQRIVRLLSQQPLDYSSIARKLNYHKGSALTEYLNELILSGYISCDYTWLIHTGELSNLAKYRLSDNYLRFYFRYIDKVLNAINKGRYKNISVNTLPGWHTVLGLQFENLVLNNRELIWESLAIKPEDILEDGPFFQRPTKRQKGCQIDYLIQTKGNTLFVCEIKFSNNIDAGRVIHQVKEKIQKIALPRGYAAIPVLIHASTQYDDERLGEYFFKAIDFNQYLT